MLGLRLHVAIPGAVSNLQVVTCGAQSSSLLPGCIVRSMCMWTYSVYASKHGHACSRQISPPSSPFRNVCCQLVLQHILVWGACGRFDTPDKAQLAALLRCRHTDASCTCHSELPRALQDWKVA